MSSISIETRQSLDNAYRSSNHAAGHLSASYRLGAIATIDGAICEAKRATFEDGYSEYVSDRLAWAIMHLTAARTELDMPDYNVAGVQHAVSLAISLLCDVACFSTVRPAAELAL